MIYFFKSLKDENYVIIMILSKFVIILFLEILKMNIRNTNINFNQNIKHNKYLYNHLLVYIHYNISS